MHLGLVFIFCVALVTRSIAFVSPQSFLAVTKNIIKRRKHPLNMTVLPQTSSTVKSVKRAAIVGGGPAGAMMAIYLSQQAGFEVDIFEAMEEKKISGPTVRSWNIVLFERGMEAMKAGGVDLAHEAGELAIRLTGSLQHHNNKRKTKSFSGCLSICRGDFSKVLLNKANKLPNTNIHFDCRFSTLDIEKRVAKFERGNGDTVDYSYDLLVGADGVNSRVRSTLEGQIPEFTVRQREDPMAFKTILIPVKGLEGAEESWKSRFHVTNSKIGCIIAPPRSDGMLTATVVLPGEGPNSFESLMKTTQDVRNFFGKWYPNAFGPQGPTEEIARDFLDRRSQHLKSTYCSRLAHGNVVLIGDAAHSMWASLGQGVNAALEDCQVLANVLKSAAEAKPATAPVDIPKVLNTYNQQRFEDARAVCLLSEEALGGGRSMRPAFAAQLFLTVMLNKTLGLLAPKIFTPPSLMAIKGNTMTYGDMFRGVKREARVLKGFLFAAFVFIATIFAKRVVSKL